MVDVAEVDVAVEAPASDGNIVTLTVSSRRVRQLLSLVVGLLLIAHLAGQYSVHFWGHPNIYGLVPRFDMNKDPSVPAFFSTLLLLSIAAMLMLTTGAAHQSGERFILAWAGLTLLFSFLAVDEAAALHELMSRPLQETMGITGGWLRFTWVLPGAAAVVLLALIYRPFIRALPPQTRRGFIAGTLILVCGALGVETIGGWYRATRGYDFRYMLLVAVEETLEMAGAIVVLCTFIAHYARTYADVRLRFRSA